MRTHLLTWLGILIFCTGCDSARRLATAVGELQVVQADVARFVKADANSIEVSLMNRRFLTLTLVNSALNDANDSEKEGKAKDVARLAYRSYPRRADVEKVHIVLATHRTHLLLFSTSSWQTFEFPVRELTEEASPTGAR